MLDDWFFNHDCVWFFSCGLHLRNFFTNFVYSLVLTHSSWTWFLWIFSLSLRAHHRIRFWHFLNRYFYVALVLNRTQKVSFKSPKASNFGSFVHRIDWQIQKSKTVLLFQICSIFAYNEGSRAGGLLAPDILQIVQNSSKMGQFSTFLQIFSSRRPLGIIQKGINIHTHILKISTVFDFW